jgi:hypothetical protein
VRSIAALNLEAALGVPVVGGLFFNRHAEGPDMAFEILGAIAAVAIELRLGLADDLGPRCARRFAMRVDIFADRKLDVHRLRILAADRLRAFVVVGPFIADHHNRIAIAHFRMRQIAVGIEQHEQGLEAEGVFEPAERRLAVLIADGAGKPFASRMIDHVSFSRLGGFDFVVIEYF